MNNGHMSNRTMVIALIPVFFFAHILLLFSINEMQIIICMVMAYLAGRFAADTIIDAMIAGNEDYLRHHCEQIHKSGWTMKKLISWRMNECVYWWMLLSIASALISLWAIGPGYDKIDSYLFLPIVGLSHWGLMIGSSMATLEGYDIRDKEMDQMMKEITDKDRAE